jgi:hypothetical protein
MITTEHDPILTLYIYTVVSLRRSVCSRFPSTSGALSCPRHLPCLADAHALNEIAPPREGGQCSSAAGIGVASVINLSQREAAEAVRPGLNVRRVARGPLPRSSQEWRVALWRRASPASRRPLDAPIGLYLRLCDWVALGSKDSPIRSARYGRPPFPAHSSLLASEFSTSVFTGAARVARRRRRAAGRLAAEFHPLRRP